MWGCSSAGEHFVDIEGVTGSIPVTPTIFYFISIIYMVLVRPFSDDAFRQPNMKRLLEITKAIPFGNRGAPKGEPWDAEIKVTTQNGKVKKTALTIWLGGAVIIQ